MPSRLHALSKTAQEQLFLDNAAPAEYHPGKLAKRLNISSRQLQRYFRQATGEAPKDWLHRQRMKTALRMLKSEDTVKSVAYEVGYKQVSHFSRDFKQHFGITPSKVLKENTTDACAEKAQENSSETEYTTQIRGHKVLPYSLKARLEALGYEINEVEAVSST
ncbi:MAG: AraC family transcriptional regulator [Opitutales bacterium]|nr:AraC family transcriptional regulator [Opitutales bacterium]